MFINTWALKRQSTVFEKKYAILFLVYVLVISKYCELTFFPSIALAMFYVCKTVDHFVFILSLSLAPASLKTQ